MLNKAREIMKQRENMIAEAKEVLVVLGATNEATIVNNQIVINKGKVVAIETTNDEYIEQLLKDLDNRNKRIEELKAQLEREQQLYRDLEFEANEEIDAVAEKRDKEIARLKAENEKLRNDFIVVNNDLAQIETNYELIKRDLSNRVDRINELELQLDELNRNYSALDSENDQLDKEIHVLEGKVAGYEMQIAKLKVEASKPRIIIEDDPDFNDEPEEKPVTNNKPMNNPISLTYTSLHVTHDAIKAIAHDKANGVTFHFVWKAGQEKLPCYSATGARGTWSRMNGTGMYRYGKQVVEDFKQLAEEKIISKTKDGRVKTTKVNKPNKPEDKPVVKETKEVVVETNDDPLGNTDDMEFDCYDC